MNLKDQINSDIKDAMRAKDQAALRALRSVKSAVLLAETDGSGREVDDSSVLKIIQKLVKQRKESLELFENENRSDLADKEKEELEVLEKYLPKAMDKEELHQFLENLVDELNADSMKDMGRVMSEAQSRIAGRADGKEISAIVRNLLA